MMADRVSLSVSSRQSRSRIRYRWGLFATAYWDGAGATTLILGHWLVILFAVRDFQISIAPATKGSCFQGLGFRYQSQRRPSAIHV